MSKRGKGVVATTTAFLPSGRTLTSLQMYDPKLYKIPNRWNTPPYFQMANTEPTIVKTPEGKGVGNKFLHKRHPASKPVKFGPLSRAAE